MATKAELYERAGELGIQGRDGMTKSKLAEAIKKAEEIGNPVENPSPEELAEARGKDPEELVEQAATADKVQERKAAEKALEEKAAKAAEEKRKQSLKRPLSKRYVVTKGCLMSRNGMLSDLPVGSIVSNKTHNLNQIRRSGGEFEEVKSVKLVQDQFRRPRTVVEK